MIQILLAPPIFYSVVALGIGVPFGPHTLWQKGDDDGYFLIVGSEIIYLISIFSTYMLDEPTFLLAGSVFGVATNILTFTGTEKNPNLQKTNYQQDSNI